MPKDCDYIHYPGLVQMKPIIAKIIKTTSHQTKAYTSPQNTHDNKVTYLQKVNISEMFGLHPSDGKDDFMISYIYD